MEAQTRVSVLAALLDSTAGEGAGAVRGEGEGVGVMVAIGPATET